MFNQTFDQSKHKWREVKAMPEDTYNIHYHYTVLGYDLEAGVFDMVLRWEGDGGHCHRHRHTATTTIIVLEGEQHLCDLGPDGSEGKRTVRQAGEYGLSVGSDQTPHMERGGKDGGMVFYSCHSNTGSLYEILNDDMSILWEVKIAELVADWEANAV